MRQDWIDSLRGMAIILVIVAHLNVVSSELNQYIYSFHMPLFFFISGYLFNAEKYINIGQRYFEKKSHSLIIPYLSFSIISYIYYIILDCVYQPGIQNVEVFREGILFNIYTIIFSVSGYLVNTPLWFLPCLFITDLLFLISKKYFKHDYKVLFLIILLSIIGFLYNTYIPFRMPWGIDIAFTGVVFYSAGYFFKKNYKNTLLRTNYSFIVVLFLTHIILSFTNPRVDMYKLIYNNYFLFYTSAFSGILTYIYIFKMIRPSKILMFYGRNSLSILGFHYLIISVLRYSFPPLLTYLNLHINENTLFIINIVFTLILIVPVIAVTNKYFPYVAGKNRQQINNISLQQENPEKSHTNFH